MSKFNFFVLIFLLGMMNSLFAQVTLESTTEAATSIQSKQEMQKLEDEQTFLVAEDALKNRNFVMESDRITHDGKTFFNSAEFNFISIEGDRGVVQVAFDDQGQTANGIGGMTLEGAVTKVSIKQDKSGNVDYRYTVRGLDISAQIRITLIAGSNEASATIDSNFTGKRLTMGGKIIPFDQSEVFKGRVGKYR